MGVSRKIIIATGLGLFVAAAGPVQAGPEASRGCGIEKQADQEKKGKNKDKADRNQTTEHATGSEEIQLLGFEERSVQRELRKICRQADKAQQDAEQSAERGPELESGQEAALETEREEARKKMADDDGK